MKVYISLPIAGFESTVRKRFDEAKRYILEKYPDAIICGPVNIDYFDDNGLTVEHTHEWSWYMGEDVKILLDCTHIFMCRGFLNSRGCKDELAIAREDGKFIFYANDAFSSL